MRRIAGEHQVRIGWCGGRLHVAALSALAIVFWSAGPAGAVVTLPFAEDFESPLGSEWTLYPGSAWTVSGGTANITGGTGVKAASVEVAEDGLRMSTTFRASSFVGNSDIGFGVFGETSSFEFVNNEDHYLADVKSNGSMRILQIEGTPFVATTLVQAPAGTFSFDTSETYRLTFESLPVVGTNQLRLTIDDPSQEGPVMMAVTDDTLLTGDHFGIRARESGGSTVASFDDFQLTDRVAPLEVVNFDMGNSSPAYLGLAAALDTAGTGAVWTENVAANDNTQVNSFGGPSDVVIWLEPAANLGNRGSDWQLDGTIGSGENELQGDLIWVSQGGLDYDLNHGGNGAYDLIVKGLDERGIYDIYVYGGSGYDTLVSLGNLSRTMTGDPNPDALTWREGQQFVLFRGLAGATEYPFEATLAPGSSQLAISGFQVVLTGYVPEPSSALLLLLGACGLVLRRRQQ